MSSFRERLFRPYRWRLSVQFALLFAFVLIAPMIFTAQRLLDSGREVLIEHEIIDLSDESNLRVNEFREDMAYLSIDVLRGITDEYAKDLKPNLNRIAQSLALPTQRSDRDPATVVEARRRFLHGTNGGVYRYELEQGVVLNLAASVDLPTDARQLEALSVCFRDGAKRAGHPVPTSRSGLHYIPGTGEGHGRTVLAFTQRHGNTYYSFLFDFTRYVWNRQQISPRHFYIVADPAGRVLIHPDSSMPHQSTRMESLANWDYPKFADSNWFNVVDLSVAQRKQRMAKAVREGGARLAAVAVPGLSYLYRKGYFAESTKTLADSLGEKSSAAAHRLNQLMAAELAKDTRLRVGEATPAIGYIEVSHPDPALMQSTCDLITQWWREESGQTNKVKWSVPLECRTLQGQLTPLRVDLNDEFDASWLIVAASPEELKEDIDDRFRAVFSRWVLPTLIVSTLLGIGLVYMLTRSLNNLATAAEKLDEANPKPLPLGGPYEVSQLALTLDHLARDVKARDRELRERAVRYETILRAAGEGIVITDAEGRIEEANKAAGRMFGCGSESLIGKPLAAFMTNAEALTPLNETQNIDLSAQSRSLDCLQGIRQDGSVFWLEVNQKQVPLQDRVVVTSILRDISLRKEADERIRKLNDDLDNRVKMRTAELEEANTKLEVALRQAEAASRAKDTFVANMSHELRQPLHIIIGFTEAMREEAPEVGAAELLPDLNKVLAAAKHLLDLINDILDMAKISSGKMELSVAPFPVSKLVEEVQTLVAPLAVKNENTFTVNIAPELSTMVSDERRTRQILINLLSNAFKFTKTGTVTLNVTKLTERGRDWIRFSIRDTGKGLSPEQIGRLFQRFYQGDSSTTRGQSGTGLGLAITQSFCELLNGQPIQVTSELGVGSEFIVTLPLVVESTETQSRPKKSENTLPLPALALPVPAADGRVVLVIDDDPMVRELMQRFLTKEGFKVLLAENGKEGWLRAKQAHPSVITLDVMMPESDGWELLGKLKDDPETADIPVVMLTIVDDRGRGFALGAADYLTKPIDWQRLGTIIRKYLTPDRSKHILVIDDDEGNREIVRRQLENDGWIIAEAADGEQGLQAFADSRPGLILLDLMMPRLDGFGFLDQLSKRFPGHRVPVVVLTAKELTSQDFDRLNGRVARIIEKGDANHLQALMGLIRQTAKKLPGFSGVTT